MSEQIREQVSAFLDGELPNSETELLLKRLTRDAELREKFGRYALIGEACRGARTGHLTRSFAGRVNVAIDGEPLAPVAAGGSPVAHWWRPVAGSVVAAGVAVVAVFALQQRANTPTVTARNAPTAVSAPAAVLAAVVKPAAAVPGNKEPLSYTVPASLGDANSAMPAARLTNYVFAHSRYPSLLGQRDVLTDLIVASDDQPVAGAEPSPAPSSSFKQVSAVATESRVDP